MSDNSPHSHDDNHGCGCGHDHSDHNCGCGHDHGDQDHSCGCGHDHSDHDHSCGCDGECCSGHQPRTIELSPEACDFLATLAQFPFLPLTRFLMTSTKSDHLESVALAPVLLTDGTESVAQVRELGEMLSDLENMGLITLDYDMPLQGFDYALYQNSVAFHALEELVAEGRNKEGFLFDSPVLEKGSIALTDLGRQVIDQLDIK